MGTTIHPMVARFEATLAEIRREELMEAHRKDSLLIQEGKRAERERVEAFGGQCFYEPEGAD